MFGLAVFDELASGIGPVATPDIERSFGASHALATAILFLIPGVVGFALEPIILVLADRYPRRWFIRAGVAGMAVAALAASLAPGPIALAASISGFYVSIGASSSLAQATLVDESPNDRARTIARFSLLSLAGDVGAPLLLGALAIAGGSWRIAYALMAPALAAWAIALAFAPLPGRTPAPDDEPAPSVLATVRGALADRQLMMWMFATAMCDLLDEILVVLASIHVRDDLSAGVLWQTITIAAFVAGNALGLVALDRVLRHHPERRVLAACAAACSVSYLAWLFAPTPLSAAILIVPVGITAAPLYPLASAQVYAARPNASGQVLLVSHLFTPLGLALPFLLGIVADHAGAHVALALLVAEPLALLALSARCPA